MSSTLMRLGLWILIIVLVLYVLQESFENLPFAELSATGLLQKGLLAGVALIGVGFILRIFEKGAKVVTKSRCVVCKTPVAHGAIYCRAHLRNILSDEDDKTHMTRIRRR